jgi:hypothetical protein
VKTVIITNILYTFPFISLLRTDCCADRQNPLLLLLLLLFFFFFFFFFLFFSQYNPIWVLAFCARSFQAFCL